MITAAQKPLLITYLLFLVAASDEFRELIDLTDFRETEGEKDK